MKRFLCYQTTYVYDTGIKSVTMKSEYKKPIYSIGEVIEISLFINDRMVKRPSRIIKILQEEIETTEEYYLPEWEK